MKTSTLTFLCLFSLITLAFSQSNDHAKPFTLRGTIIGQPSGIIFLNYMGYEKYIKDTVAIKNGEFVFKGNIAEPTRAYIVGNSKAQSVDDPNIASIFIEPGVMKVKLTKDKFEKIKVTGSKTQNESNELELLLAPLDKKIEPLKDQFSCLEDSIKKTKDKLLLNKLKKNLDDNMIQMEKLQAQYKTVEINFIHSHPGSFVSADLLSMTVANDEVSVDSLRTLYNGLKLIVQNSKKGKEIKKVIDKKEKIAIGVIAPDFKTVDINNQSVVLSDFIGKNEVLLVFWASWCIPCRESFPHLKELYQKYHSKGLEIIGVSIDYSKEAWIAAVTHDSVGMWHQVHSSGKFIPGPPINNEIRDKYCVAAVPVKILIDRKGRIVGNWKFSIEALDEKLTEIYKE